MGKAICYGIDLGTTNSAIAVSTGTGDDIKIIKNRDQMEVTASAVRIEKNGSVQVGRRAYETNFVDPDNVATEFKRWMGKLEKKLFKASGRSMNAEELSAEILKSLLADAEKLSEDRINAAVITVPAAFGNLQCEATAQAAALAGLEEAPLLPEPIAAAVAYGMDKDRVNQNWLVYDWGGGTFDTAIVSTRNKRLQVLAHQGNNLLGGKDIDNILIKNVLMPELEQKYDLPSISEDPIAFHHLRQYLKGKAEEIKKELSFSDDVAVFELDVGKDNNGKRIDLEFSFTRRVFEELIRGLVDETIVLCKKALDEARLLPNQIDRIILVGGSTFIIPVRHSLLKSFDVKLEHSHDPITVVARGAALFAATAPQKAKKVKGKGRHEGVLQFELSYPLESSDERCPVAGNCSDTLGVKGLQIKIEAKDNYWNSGWVDADEGYFELEVLLLKDKSCRFWLYARDGHGRLREVEPEGFTVIQRPVVTADPPLSRSIGLEIVELSGTKTTMDPIFKRSTPIPAKGLEWSGTYRTTRDLLPTHDNPEEYIALKIYEGESGDPSRNDFAGAIVIRPHHLERPLFKGSELELHVNIDQSRLIKAWAYAPAYELSFFNLYERNVGTEITFEDEIREKVDQVYDVIATLKEELETRDDSPLLDRLDQTQEAVDHLLADVRDLCLDKYSMVDQKEEIYRRLAKIKEELYCVIDAEVKPRHDELIDSDKMRISASIKQIENDLEKLYGLPDLTKYQEAAIEKITEKLEKIKEDGLDTTKMLRINRLQDSLDDLERDILYQQLWWWKEYLDWLSRPGHQFKDEAVAAEQLKKGKSAHDDGDVEELRNIVFYLLQLLPEDEVTKIKKGMLEARVTRKRYS